MNTFLPKGYEVPASNSNYLTFQDGQNTFRVLSNAIIGYEYWTEDKKPIRSKEQFTSTPNIRMENGKPSKVKHFWAFVVWNYSDHKIQILEVTQSTIQQGIGAIIRNKQWGDPKGYDICITKTGQDMETRYSVMPTPHQAVSPKITEQLNATKINLEALYVGADPFVENEQMTTAGVPAPPAVQGSGQTVAPAIQGEVLPGGKPLPPVPQAEEIQVENIPF